MQLLDPDSKLQATPLERGEVGEEVGWCEEQRDIYGGPGWKEAGWKHPVIGNRGASTPCLVTKFKVPKKISAPTWRLKSRRNKKRIAQFACKSRDKANEPN